MPSCGAPGCTNRSTDGKNLTFHRLPSQKKRNSLRLEWIQNIKRQNVPKELFICSVHFEESCFKRDLKSELVAEAKPRHELLDDAVPTIFNHKSFP